MTLRKDALLCGIVLEVRPRIVQLDEDHLRHHLVVGAHLLFVEKPGVSTRCTVRLSTKK